MLTLPDDFRATLQAADIIDIFHPWTLVKRIPMARQAGQRWLGRVHRNYLLVRILHRQDAMPWWAKPIPITLMQNLASLIAATR